MDRGQMWLLPPSLEDLVPLDHPARFVAEFVDAIDSESGAEMGVPVEGDPLGAPAYHPRALLCVWLYGFMTGVRSSRKLEAACRDQIPYLWLTGWQHPDHNTLWRFYKKHRQGMRNLFKRTVRTAVAMELVDLAVQAVDGTKIAASAARDRTYDADKMGKLLERVEQAIVDLEAQNEAGEGTEAPHLPGKLADKRALRERVRPNPPMGWSGAREVQGDQTWDQNAPGEADPDGVGPDYNEQCVSEPMPKGIADGPQLRWCSGRLTTAGRWRPKGDTLGLSLAQRLPSRCGVVWRQGTQTPLMASGW